MNAVSGFPKADFDLLSDPQDDKRALF